MKKIILLTISILMVSVAFAKAGNPIPSYNVPISNKDYFVEDNSLPNAFAPCDEKRDMNISNDTPGSKQLGSGGFSSNSGNIAVYIYRLDQTIILGPYVLAPGEKLTIRIDGNLWGVTTQTNPNELAYVSVWTTGGGHGQL
jgi:hypothetical protein